jgi:hypothetical protein
LTLAGTSERANTPQGEPQFFRNSSVDVPAVGLFDNPRTASPRSKRRKKKRLRGAKLVAAFAVTALVGVGSYAATYQVLVLVSAPATATGLLPNHGSLMPATLPAAALPPS